MGSSKRQRNRGFLLSDRGKLRLETARHKAEKLNNEGKRYTVEQLSQITGLDLSTVTRVLDTSIRIDRRTLERFFQGFNLDLEAKDFYKPQLPNLQPQPTSLPIYYPINYHNIYGRERELAQLKEYISDNKTIILYGTTGVGKTALASKLVDEIKGSFEYVCWQQVSSNSPLEMAIAILRCLSLEIERQDFNSLVTQLIIFLQQQRCLLIFDNLEVVIDRQTKAFFNYLCATVHNSCIILISRQRLDTVTLSKCESVVIEEISLEAGKKLLRDRSITADDKILEKLIQSYNLHPLNLHIAATTILDIFNGNVKDFLAHKITIFHEIEEVLERQQQQLSKLEISILSWLAVNTKYISLARLKDNIVGAVSYNQIVVGLRRLRNYLLIKKIENKFTIQPPFGKYIINFLVQHICQQVAAEKDELLTTNALLEVTAPDFIQQQQIEFVIKPITEKLVAKLGRDRLLAIFADLLDRQRRHTPQKPGYLAGNIFNFLRYLEVDLARWNFSNLSVWQADARGVNLRHCNFAFANLTQSKFTEDFGETLSLAISPDKKQLAACDTNGQIRLWNLRDKRQQQTLRGHTAWTQMVVYSPDGQTLASCSSDRTVRLWNLNSGRCIGILKSHRGRVRAIAFTSDGHLASAGDDLAIKLWDVNTQTVIQTFEGHTDNIRSIIITANAHIISSGDDGSIRFWNLNGRCLRTIEAHQKPVWTVAISPDGSLVASGSVDNTVKLWNSNTGELITSFQHQGTVSRIAFSPDGKLLASASYDCTVRIWNVATRRQLKILRHNDWVQSLVFNDNNLITCSRDLQIKHWNVNTEQVDTTINSYSNGIWAIAVSPDNKQIASSNDEQTIQLWGVAQNKIERVLTGHNKSVWSVAYSQDNRFLASASDDGTVRIWNLGTGKLHRTIQSDTWFWTVAFSPHSSILATAGADYTIKFWNVATGKVVKTFNGHTEIVRHITFDSEGEHLASCGMDNTARVWRMDTGECVSIFNHASPVSSVAFSPTRSLLATGNDDNIVRLWDFSTGQIVQSFESHTGWVQSVAFSLSEDGREILASGSHDGTIRLWHQNQKHALATLEHGGWVRAIAFRTCPTTGQLQLVSGSQNGTIKLWDINSQSCIKTLCSPQPYSQMNITGVTGLSKPERETLIALGAVETNVSALDNIVYLRQFQSMKSIRVDGNC